MVCNPTSRMPAPWQAPSKTCTPYPEDLPISERAIWDAKSEAEVALATKLKIMDKNIIVLAMDAGNTWEKWWLRRDQPGSRNWQDRNDPTHDKHQKILVWRLEAIQTEELGNRTWGIDQTRRPGYPNEPYIQKKIPQATRSAPA